MNRVPHIAAGKRSTGFDATVCGQEEKAGSYTYSVATFRMLAGTTNRVCQHCRKALAKRDREFQRKARKQFNPFFRYMTAYHFKFGRDAYAAARAIAREEGRAP